MHLGKKDHNNTDYYMNSQHLLTVTEEKDLGVVITMLLPPHSCTELEVAVKVCVKNISKLVYCKVFI